MTTEHKEVSTGTSTETENKSKSVLGKNSNLVTLRLLSLILYLFLPLLVILSSLVIPVDRKGYFTNSNNLINKVVAKQAWLWTSITFLLLQLRNFNLNKKLDVKPWLRYLAATFYWYLLTQELVADFSFRDQVFIATGGFCKHNSEISSFKMCGKQGKDGWVGGHLISGHCLLLIHSSLFLWEEFNFLLCAPHRIGSSFDRAYTDSEKLLIYWARALLTLFLWLLLITCVYFHTSLEKLSGITLAFAYWFVMYLKVFPCTSFEARLS